MTTHAVADRALTPSFALRWLIVAAAACVVLSLIAGWAGRSTHLAPFATVGQAPLHAAITLVLDDVALPTVVVG